MSLLPPLERAVRQHGEVVVPHLVVRQHQHFPSRVHGRVEPVPVVVVLGRTGLKNTRLLPPILENPPAEKKEETFVFKRATFILVSTWKPFTKR